MRGTIIKRGQSYSVVIEVGRDPATGRRLRKWHSGFRTKKDAERARIELLGRLAGGTYVEPSRQTVGEYLAKWLVATRSTLRPSTFDSYSRNVRVHVLPRIGSLTLASVDGGTLNALYAELLSNGRQPATRSASRPDALVAEAKALRDGGATYEAIYEQLRRQWGEVAPPSRHAVASMLRRAGTGPADGRTPPPPGLSPRTVRYVHTILHRAFRDAVRWNRLVRNPADAADPPRAERRQDLSTWSPAELQRFLELASGDRLGVAWLTLATTGLRRGELLGLRWEDVDLDASTLSVRQTVVMVGGQVQTSAPKTARSRRSVALDSATTAALRAHRRRQHEERLALGAGWQDHGLVFTSVEGGPLHPDRFSREFDRRVARWGLPRIRLHDLRHTWATLALTAGVHPKVVSERLGHAGIAITLDVYSHVTPALEREAADTVAALVFGSAD